MTKARNIADLLDANGDVKSASLDNVPAVDLTNLSASNLTSGTIPDARVSASAVSQHATSFDDNAIVNDLSTIALRQATNENAIAYNTNSMFVDVFQDDTGIGTETNTDRNASEYVSSTVETVESGGTVTNIDQVSGYVWNSSNFETEPNGEVYYNVTNGNHIGYTGNSTPLTGNYKMTWKSGTSNTSNQVSSSNNGIQIGIALGTQSNLATGSSIYNNGDGFLYYVMHNGAVSSGNQTLYYVKGQTNQGSDSIAFDTNYYLQLVRDASAGTLKLYGHASNSNPYTQSGSLLHTYSGYSGSQADDIVFGTGYPNNTLINSGTYLMRNASIKTGITSLAGGTTTNATGNFISNAITAPTSTSSMGAIITYQDQAGTNALNTDIVLQLSADNGSNYSTATLTAMPDFSTGIKMAKVNDLAVTAGTQLKYKISFANQSGSKEARIRGVSLQY